MNTSTPGGSKLKTKQKNLLILNNVWLFPGIVGKKPNHCVPFITSPIGTHSSNATSRKESIFAKPLKSVCLCNYKYPISGRSFSIRFPDSIKSGSTKWHYGAEGLVRSCAMGLGWQRNDHFSKAWRRSWLCLDCKTSAMKKWFACWDLDVEIKIIK